VDKLGENSSQAFFAVYDGHGGNGAALYSASNLHVVRISCWLFHICLFLPINACRFDFVLFSVAQNLAAALKEIPEGDITEESIHSAFKQAYSKTDVDMKVHRTFVSFFRVARTHDRPFVLFPLKTKEPVPNAGSCAVTALVRVVGDKKFLYIANVGDSRAVLVRAEGKVLIPLSNLLTLTSVSVTDRKV
jgi:serine/threonine protein phosphatase PrpC